MFKDKFLKNLDFNRKIILFFFCIFCVPYSAQTQIFLRRKPELVHGSPPAEQTNPYCTQILLLAVQSIQVASKLEQTLEILSLRQ